MFKYCSLFSGSSGNCFFIKSDFNIKIAATKYIAATATYITWKYSILNGINMFTPIYNIFNITDSVIAYTDILNNATKRILIFASIVVINPKILNNTTFDIVVKKYIINEYIKIVKNKLEYNLNIPEPLA